ncbi:MAG: chorismate synthase [Planctomycetia bacterium]|nr:chorismate synthase [Planctomycetia bacterium]
MLTYHTAGESHGKGLLALVDGFPAGLEIRPEVINYELKRRQGGYGRGGRQNLETDTAEIMTGVWDMTTIGSPIALWVKNRDYRLPSLPDLETPRPGHGDLSGSRKYLSGMRAILERASARETAARVAAGGLARQLLTILGIEVFGFTAQVAGLDLTLTQDAQDAFKILESSEVEMGATSASDAETKRKKALEKLRNLRDENALYALSGAQETKKVTDRIDQAAGDGDTLGGILEVRAFGLPFGLGTHAQWDEKLDGKLAQAVMAIQAMKGVEIGLGFQSAKLPGSEVHDAIGFDVDEMHTRTLGFTRPTNRAGGLEAGMTNAQPLVIRAAMKPIATLRKGLPTVNPITHEPVSACWERSDICAVSAAGVVVENVVAFALATAITEKFGNDSVAEIQARVELFQKMAETHTK